MQYKLAFTRHIDMLHLKPKYPITLLYIYNEHLVFII